MIARSRVVQLTALGIALVAHGAFAVALYQDEPVMVEGSGVQETALGTSFADMAAGTLTAEEPEEITEVEPEETAEPVDPVEETPPEELEVTETEQPEAAEAPQPDAVDEPVEEVQTLTAPETPDGILPLRPEPLEPETAELPETLEAPQAVEAVRPEDTIEVIDPDTDVPRLSKRPMLRDPAMETPIKRAEAPKPKPKPKPKPQTQQAKKPAPKPAPQKTTQGNSNQNAKAGTTRGTANATAKQQGSGNAKKRQAGNAAVSNYPGLVNRHLARVRKPSLNRRGTVRVSFSIASSGGLGGVSVSGSSGSSQLDQAAVQMIRRAAPFPRPPAGAQTRFTISIQFR